MWGWQYPIEYFLVFPTLKMHVENIKEYPREYYEYQSTML